MTREGCVVDVWQHNMDEELNSICELRKRFSYVFIDTEFPGFLAQPPRGVSEEDCYRAVKFNVDNLKLIQLGVTLSNGTTSYSWQFNLREFHPTSDPCFEPSIELLKKSGIDFDLNRKEGVDAGLLSNLLLEKLIHGGCEKTKWVTFHGLYDVAYIIKLIYRKPLPSTLPDFLRLTRELFGNMVYDVKCMAKPYGGPFAEVGLKRLSKMVGIDWTGESHQAGHDTLLTAMVFWKMKSMLYGFEEDSYAGILYGVEQHARYESKSSHMR